MLGQRPEAAGRGGEEKPSREPQAEAAAPASAAPAAAGPAPSGGLGAWLPLIVSLGAMPVVAYLVTSFLLVPRLEKAIRGSAAAPAPPPAAKESANSAEGTSAKEEGGAPGQRQSHTLNKLLVNVAGTLGSRYLLTSITLMGDGSDFSNKAAQKEPQLRDLANGVLSTKTIADLEKPGARNVIRGELLAGFNSILGSPGVQEIYFTEFAIQ